MRSALGENDMMAYLAMMAVRLIELHRVSEAYRISLSALRPNREPLFENIFSMPSSSLTVSQMKLFGNDTTGKSLMKRRLLRNHDVILFVSEGIAIYLE